MPALRSARWNEEVALVVAGIVDRGVPEDLARAHAVQGALVHAPDALAVARDTGWEVEDVARTFFGIGEGLSLEWLEREIDALPAATRLQRWAAQAVRDDVLAARRLLARRALEEASGRDPDAAVEAFLAARAEPRRRLSSFTRALALEGTTDLAGLSLAVRHLMDLAA